MQYLPTRLLAISSVALAGLCACMASTGKSSGSGLPRAATLYVDYSTKTIAAPSWNSSFIDCSTEELFCLSVPSRMILAFPRQCKDSRAQLFLSQELGTLRRVAPAEHQEPPAGSYNVDSFPSIIFFYSSQTGVTEVREVVTPPGHQAFDPNALRNRYSIKTADGSKLFPCKRR